MTKTVTLQVNGMSCNHCVNAIESALKEIGGVDSVRVDLDAGRVTVTYDETIVDLNNLKDAIEEEGYDVVS
ncbi:copper chaperone CopZ [Collibacillus ludicampi]|jgi:copper chaperone|uniref:Copper chaperone CopZ n=1 Tax=Collibacillus ludicampi TaxID=2771369 RepID=A0AAV4LEG2_9BACL|nr:copper chaperone CopZ [Collibacillus ludicampi]GIM46222.1 copper chaperone CopZ [Collibacillus ludicampi]